MKPPLRLAMRLFFQSPSTAARPVIWLCAATELDDSTAWYLHMKRRREPDEPISDPAVGSGLWSESQALIAKLWEG